MYAYVQKGFGDYTTNTITWQGPTTAGNLLAVCFVKGINAGEYVASLAGNVNTSQPGWTSAVGTINTIGSKIATGSSNAANFGSATLLFLPGGSNAGGDTTTTATLVADFGGNCFIGAMEFSGIATASPFITYAAHAQSDPTTATDAVTSTTSSVSAAPALVCGFGYSLLEACAAGWTGTGFTGRLLDGANAYIWGEDRRVTSAASYAATFTDAVSGATDTTLAFMMAFAEPTISVPSFGPMPRQIYVMP